MQPTSHKRSVYWKYRGRRKHLANPIPDVICVVALALVLLIAGYMHVTMGM